MVVVGVHKLQSILVLDFVMRSTIYLLEVQLHCSIACTTHYFMVMVGVHVLQSILILDFVHSRVNTPDPGAVSVHRPVGSP